MSSFGEAIGGTMNNVSTFARLRVSKASVVLLLGALGSTLVACEEEQRETSTRQPTKVVATPPVITYPLDGTIFPPELPAPTIRWKSKSRSVDAWRVTVDVLLENETIEARTTKTEWSPSGEQWAAIKESSTAKAVTITVRDASETAADLVSSVKIRTAADEVGAPLFYREVNLPFIDAVKDPTNIRWRFGSISSEEPSPIVLEKLPVCGNCHSFSRDGKVLGMDVDYANDKGSYIITEVAEEIPLEVSKIITWSDYQREDGEMTFGLLSQVSPDGRYVVSTVRDQSVFVATSGLAFSQLFFPVKGILAVYDRQEKTFEALPGADDPRFVQSNPSWSPDGKQIVFAKSKAHKLKRIGREVLLPREDAAEFIEGGKQFRFDLYRIPFNSGKGGRAEPLKGASRNGMSNYFARYSPDGRWIVFTKAKSFMLLQPDSELYIMPASGGEPRKMRCNTPRMNSWHSWSPNGRWLVFSSKPDGPYTQLYLTHIDDEGRSSPPVLLDRLISRRRAANIPEFVNLEPTAIKRIYEQFVDEESLTRMGFLALQREEVEVAEKAFREALDRNPNHHKALDNLGYLLLQSDRSQEARRYLERAVKVRPDFVDSINSLGSVLVLLEEWEEAETTLTKSLALAPDNPNTLSNLGYSLEMQGKIPQAREFYEKTLQIQPNHGPANCNLGALLTSTGETDVAQEHLMKCQTHR